MIPISLIFERYTYIILLYYSYCQLLTFSMFFIEVLQIFLAFLASWREQLHVTGISCRQKRFPGSNEKEKDSWNSSVLNFKVTHSFFYDSNLFRPMKNRLKYVQIWFQYRRNILSQSCLHGVHIKVGNSLIAQNRSL